MDLDIFPGKLLANEAKTGACQKGHALLAHLGQGLILQESVGAVGADAGRGDAGFWGEVRLRAQRRVQPVQQPAKLARDLLLARQLVWRECRRGERCDQQNQTGEKHDAT